MKTSTKIVITAVGVIIALLVASMVLWRNHLETFLIQAEAANNYKAVPVEYFEKLNFSANWDVKIRQGKVYKVEVANENGGFEKTVIENSAGTLHFKKNSTTANDNSIKVKITAPALRAIKTMGSTKIEMKNFNTDSLDVALQHGDYFRGIDNVFKYVSFQSSGTVNIEVYDDPNIN
ncbi:hypothetical protein C900_02012 [Fulvivirga imtechensis AK7]|uniref:Putative auto-transporter adhesin head GIN domain-containing protein n=1 Tax=Fulvivirga imtechensis AK7 TaxID=1237149 RepID=L8JXR2_9BACT|nr:DUF2807 domain-containing protein [Fulvivirga imtechensis]ELR72017.1 hypothetical protein C900_02012 [Fulvivirga imtechensis AK7]